MVTDAERLDWLSANCTDKYLAPAGSEFEDSRMIWVLPTLISSTCVNSRLSLRESIDSAMAQKRRKDD